ncbi:ABC transporter permease [Micrococcoides hystricis]|uniref:ABC transporter permease n=1 Tax=Micrococcoides hystricis TaxID=1572761 RepID=A0ABV6PCF6_9MICC
MTTIAQPTAEAMTETQHKNPELTTADLERPSPSQLRPTIATIVRTIQDQIFNPWNLGFALGLPIVMYLMFGTGQEHSLIEVGNGNVAATILVSMALYGAIITSAATGANISVERTQGWSRQMSLTPMKPYWYIIGKIIAGVFVAGVVVSVAFVVGAVTDARMETPIWFYTALLIIAGTLITAAMGLAVGYWMRSDAAYGVMGGATALMAFFSGMFFPLEQMAEIFQNIAPYSPLYGINKLAQAPIYADGFEWGALINAISWLAIFAILAVIGRNRDTERG